MRRMPWRGAGNAGNWRTVAIYGNDCGGESVEGAVCDEQRCVVAVMDGEGNVWDGRAREGETKSGSPGR